MKKVLSFLSLATLMLSCNNYSNIKEEDICGKRFTSSVPSPIIEGVSDDTGTTLKCDGTFESGEVTRMTGQNTVNRNYFTGTWEIIKDIPEEVKSAVKRYGVNNTNYTIIKYTSSNGVTDYCIYYPVNNIPTLSPLHVSCNSEDTGIHGGFFENN